MADLTAGAFARRSAVLPWTVVAGTACIALLVALAVGSVPLPPTAVLRGLLDADSPSSDIVRGLRLPRALMAFVVGGLLAVSGAVLQAVVRNPLAEPWILGLSGGASLGAVIGTIAGVPGRWSVAACATLGALAAGIVVYRITAIAGRRLDPRVLLLAGVIVGAFATAITTAILAAVDPFTFRAATMWILGGFTGASWPALRDITLVSAVPLVAIVMASRHLDLLALGDETALALGTDPGRLRRMLLVATSIITAATVSVAGVIGFVGLIVPHAMRWMVGPLHGRLLPFVFLGGGAFTTLADTAARTVLAPAELTVGTVTALAGVPLFAVLLRRSLR